MKIALLLENFVDEVEFIYPLFRFKEDGFDVDVISSIIAEFKSKNGLILKSNYSIDLVDPKDYDCLFVPGGYAPDRLRRNQKIINFVKYMYTNNQIVCAICHGPWLLISAGIVKDKQLTSHMAIKDDLVNAGAIYTGNDVECDKNIVTAKDIDALPQMLKTIVDLLYKKSSTKNIH
ncbi:MAG: type 1 glutamine amidotransferase domain-containing protein [Desulfurella sp.]